MDRLMDEKRRLEKQPLQLGETVREQALRHNKGLFALADRMLAENRAGAHWLRDERIARLLEDALFYHHTNWYTLVAFVIMSNHVHVVLHPLPARNGRTKPRLQSETGGNEPGCVPLRKITQSLKGYTAKQANLLLGRTGKIFWQAETYDHWVRNEAELGRIITYVEFDPVRNGLVDNPELWRWSSAWERKRGRLT
jgi:putative DNA methylase